MTGWNLYHVWLTVGENGKEILDERRYYLGPTNGDSWQMESDLNDWITLGPYRHLEDVWWHSKVIKENVEPPEPYMYIRLHGSAEIPQRDCWDRTWPKPW